MHTIMFGFFIGLSCGLFVTTLLLWGKLARAVDQIEGLEAELESADATIIEQRGIKRIKVRRLNKELERAYATIEMLLKNDRPSIFDSETLSDEAKCQVAVEIGRNGVIYQFANKNEEFTNV